jgi:hypothetical protein
VVVPHSLWLMGSCRTFALCAGFAFNVAVARAGTLNTREGATQALFAMSNSMSIRQSFNARFHKNQTKSSALGFRCPRFTSRVR